MVPSYFLMNILIITILVYDNRWIVVSLFYAHR